MLLNLIKTNFIIILFSLGLVAFNGFSVKTALAVETPLDPVIVKEDSLPEVLVLYFNERLDPNTNNEHPVSLTFENKVAFNNNDVPRVVVKNFRPNSNQTDLEFLTTDDEDNVFDATDWFNGPQRLTNLKKDAKNELDFTITIPTDSVAASYRAAIVFENNQQDILGYYLIVIHLGYDLSSDEGGVVELDEQASVVDLQDELSIVFINQSQWHILPKAILNFTIRANNEVKEINYDLITPQFWGAFAQQKQIFNLNDDDLQDLKTKLDSQTDFDLVVVFIYDLGDQSYSSHFPIKQLSDVVTASNDDSDIVPTSAIDKNDISNEANNDRTAAENKTESSITPSSSTGSINQRTSSSFLNDNFVLVVVGAIVLMGVVFGVLYFMKRRPLAVRPQPKFHVQKPLIHSPHQSLSSQPYLPNKPSSPMPSQPYSPNRPQSTMPSNLPELPIVKKEDLSSSPPKFLQKPPFNKK